MMNMIPNVLNEISNEGSLLEMVLNDRVDEFVRAIDYSCCLKTDLIYSKQELLSLIGFLDLTSLESVDDMNSIKCLIENSFFDYEGVRYLVAGVCVFPNFLPLIKELDFDKELKTIVVAGGFPFSQMPLEVKLEEVRYALEHGADEIDVCINRGLFLSKNEEVVSNEIKAVKNLISTCEKSVSLKVILETGELGSYSNIMKASMLALESGADFIKTSTGKIAKGADVYSVCVMLLALRLFYKKTGMLKGLKVAGGIRSCFDALQYKNLFDSFMIKGLNDNKYFRIGCSKLFENIKSEILNGENDKIKHNL